MFVCECVAHLCLCEQPLELPDLFVGSRSGSSGGGGGSSAVLLELFLACAKVLLLLALLLVKLRVVHSAVLLVLRLGCCSLCCAIGFSIDCTPSQPPTPTPTELSRYVCS